jgi:hypothetical protein
VPGRKVSIYHKGALTALILDLEIRRLTQDARIPDDVVRGLWERYGQKEIAIRTPTTWPWREEVAWPALARLLRACITGSCPLQEAVGGGPPARGLHAGGNPAARRGRQRASGHTMEAGNCKAARSAGHRTQ